MTSSQDNYTPLLSGTDLSNQKGDQQKIDIIRGELDSTKEQMQENIGVRPCHSFLSIFIICLLPFVQKVIERQEKLENSVWMH